MEDTPIEKPIDIPAHAYEKIFQILNDSLRENGQRALADNRRAIRAMRHTMIVAAVVEGVSAQLADELVKKDDAATSTKVKRMVAAAVTIANQAIELSPAAIDDGQDDEGPSLDGKLVTRDVDDEGKDDDDDGETEADPRGLPGDDPQQGREVPAAVSSRASGPGYRRYAGPRK